MNLSFLSPGDLIRVKLSNGDSVVGNFQCSDDVSLLLKVHEKPVCLFWQAGIQMIELVEQAEKQQENKAEDIVPTCSITSFVSRATIARGEVVYVRFKSDPSVIYLVRPTGLDASSGIFSAEFCSDRAPVMRPTSSVAAAATFLRDISEITSSICGNCEEEFTKILKRSNRVLVEFSDSPYTYTEVTVTDVGSDCFTCYVDSKPEQPRLVPFSSVSRLWSREPLPTTKITEKKPLETPAKDKIRHLFQNRRTLYVRFKTSPSRVYLLTDIKYDDESGRFTAIYHNNTTLYGFIDNILVASTTLTDICYAGGQGENPAKCLESTDRVTVELFSTKTRYTEITVDHVGKDYFAGHEDSDPACCYQIPFSHINRIWSREPLVSKKIITLDSHFGAG